MYVERNNGRENQKRIVNIIKSNMKWMGVSKKYVRDRVKQKWRTRVSDPKYLREEVEEKVNKKFKIIS